VQLLLRNEVEDAEEVQEAEGEKAGEVAGLFIFE
jgi:hypothetical protein